MNEFIIHNFVSIKIKIKQSNLTPHFNLIRWPKFGSNQFESVDSKKAVP